MAPDTSAHAFENLRLDNQLCFALYAATHAITRAYRSLLTDLGITYPQYLVLIVLWENDKIPVGEIAKRLQLDAAALTPLVKRLESLGLIARIRDTRDERVVRICLSEQGKALESRAAKVQSEVGCKTGLDAKQFYELRNQLHGLVSALDRSEESNSIAA
jgi:DNA-binding MarR family transcriptional regulator